MVQEGRLRSGSSVNAELSNKQQPAAACKHIQCVHAELATQEPAESVDPHVLDTPPFPDKTREDLLSMHKDRGALILSVSENTFAVRSGKTIQQHPLGILHVRVSCSEKVSRHGSGPGAPTASRLSLPSSQAIYCPCHVHISRQAAGGPATARLSKRCIHLYLCLWAFTSDKTLAREFCMFLKVKHIMLLFYLLVMKMIFCMHIFIILNLLQVTPTKVTLQALVIVSMSSVLAQAVDIEGMVRK